MNKITEKRDFVASFKTRSFQAGGYSVAATAMVLAIAIVGNVLVNALPSKWTQIDTTAQQLSTVGEHTEQIVEGLTEDVQLYLIAQSGSEDANLENLLNKYAGMSSHISVSKKDPNVNPTFVQQHIGSSGVYNNSVVAISGDRSRYVEYYEIYEYDTSNYYYDGSYSVNFAGEAAITAAISYVTNDNLPIVYTLTGHGEKSLSSAFVEAVEKQNMELAELSLLTVETVPEDADTVLIYAPSNDITAEEKETLLAYTQQGGSLFYISDPAEESGQFSNLEALMAQYGMNAVEGIVLEANRSNYSVGGPLEMLPNISSHEITSPLLDGGYYIMTPIAHGIQISEELSENLSVNELLSTSYSAYSKVDGYALETMEKEDGDIDGPFSIAAAAADSSSGAKVVWVSTSYLLDDSVNRQVSGSNEDFFLNSLGWLSEYEDAITIHAKSLDSEYLSINDSTASLLTVVIVGLIPASYLLLGINTTLKRRKR